MSGTDEFGTGGYGTDGFDRAGAEPGPGAPRRDPAAAPRGPQGMTPQQPGRTPGQNQGPVNGAPWLAAGSVPYAEAVFGNGAGTGQDGMQGPGRGQRPGGAGRRGVPDQQPGQTTEPIGMHPLRGQRPPAGQPQPLPQQAPAPALAQAGAAYGEGYAPEGYVNGYGPRVAKAQAQAQARVAGEARGPVPQQRFDSGPYDQGPRESAGGGEAPGPYEGQGQAPEGFEGGYGQPASGFEQPPFGPGGYERPAGQQPQGPYQVFDEPTTEFRPGPMFDEPTVRPGSPAPAGLAPNGIGAANGRASVFTPRQSADQGGDAADVPAPGDSGSHPLPSPQGPAGSGTTQHPAMSGSGTWTAAPAPQQSAPQAPPVQPQPAPQQQPPANQAPPPSVSAIPRVPSPSASASSQGLSTSGLRADSPRRSDLAGAPIPPRPPMPDEPPVAAPPLPTRVPRDQRQQAAAQQAPQAAPAQVAQNPAVQEQPAADLTSERMRSVAPVPAPRATAEAAQAPVQPQVQPPAPQPQQQVQPQPQPSVPAPRPSRSGSFDSLVDEDGVPGEEEGDELFVPWTAAAPDAEQSAAEAAVAEAVGFAAAEVEPVPNAPQHQEPEAQAPAPVQAASAPPAPVSQSPAPAPQQAPAPQPQPAPVQRPVAVQTAPPQSAPVQPAPVQQQPAPAQPAPTPSQAPATVPNVLAPRGTRRRVEPSPAAAVAPRRASAPAVSAAAPTAPAAAQQQAGGDRAPAYEDEALAAVYRVIHERRDVRNDFLPDEVPVEVLTRILEAAHTAPSVGFSQPWDFLVIRDPAMRQSVHDLAARQRRAYASSLPKARARAFTSLKTEAILETPVNIVVTCDPTRGGRHTLGRHTQPLMAPFSSCLAVENLWLAARAEGLGVGWVSFFDERELAAVLDLPDHLQVVAYLCVGYVSAFPQEPELAGAGWAKRRPLAWAVHEERFGHRALPGAEPISLLNETVDAIRGLDADAVGAARDRQARMTKPPGSLGALEAVSEQLSGLAGTCPPPLPEPAAIAVFAGDHGVHAQGVTPWPQEVTAQMVANFLAGGAVVNAFAKQVGAEVCVVDVGVNADLATQAGLVPRKIRYGTADMTQGPALTRDEAVLALEAGIETARDLVAAGNRCLLTGDMGIANTTASAALIAAFTGASPAQVTGYGTGIDEQTYAHKVEVVGRALALHRPDPHDPVGVLAAFGGLEHAALAGFILGAAALRTPVVLDGVIAGAAALVAQALSPDVTAACVAGHRSAEPGHALALEALGITPLIDLELRLGEGSGAALALPLVGAAVRALREVATFDDAGVADASDAVVVPPHERDRT
jgi:nicotinate-nucleotide--dimethylbenzimidazole phosphoribosyltransferase